MLADNKIVHGLWIGKHLSPVELLCIKSFLANGHEFHLWAYDVIETVLPEGLIIEDAKKIIPAEKIFCYKNSNQFGHGKGSYAGFSDIFRYKLLYEKGGWWVDMDVICLKPLDFSAPYVFRTHHDFPVVGNVMKCPKKSVLMRLCYERAIMQVDENNRDWNLPITILNDAIKELNLSEFIVEISNPDSWLYLRKLLSRRYKIPSHWYVIHMMNEEWRYNKIDKKAIPKNSEICVLLKKYGIWEQAPLQKRIKNKIRLLVFRFSWKRFLGLAQRIFWKTVRLFIKEKTQK